VADPGFKTRKDPVRKVVCAACELPTDIFLGVSILGAHKCARCGERAGYVVQEIMPLPKRKKAIPPPSSE
jgi:hypothetical protein